MYFFALRKRYIGRNRNTRTVKIVSFRKEKKSLLEKKMKENVKEKIKSNILLIFWMTNPNIFGGRKLEIRKTRVGLQIQEKENC